MSHLFGRSRTLWIEIDNKMHKSESGMSVSVDTIYKSDALWIYNGSFADFSKLMTTKHSSNESFLNFESRFVATVAELNSNGTFVSISETLTAWLLIHNSSIYSSQHLGVISATPSAADANVSHDLPEKRFPSMHQIFSCSICPSSVWSEYGSATWNYFWAFRMHIWKWERKWSVPSPQSAYFIAIWNSASEQIIPL